MSPLAVAVASASGRVPRNACARGETEPEAAAFFYDGRARVLAHTATPTRRTS